MTKASKGRAIGSISVQARRADQAVRKARYTIDTLHELWLLAEAEDQTAQSKLYTLLASHPDLRIAIDLFRRGRDPHKRNALRHQLISCKAEPKPKTLWTSLKPRWISIVEGGLPGLGKRR